MSIHSRRIAGRVVGVLAVAVAFLGAATGTASASAPTIQRLGPFVQDSIETSCGFDVHVTVTYTVFDIQWTDAAGDFRDFSVLPLHQLVATNVQTGKTITDNISAEPGVFTSSSDGSARFVATGVWLWGLNLDTGALGLFLQKGRYVQEVDLQGNLTSSRTGILVDLCAELATA